MTIAVNSVAWGRCGAPLTALCLPRPGPMCRCPPWRLPLAVLMRRVVTGVFFLNVPLLSVILTVLMLLGLLLLTGEGSLFSSSGRVYKNPRGSSRDAALKRSRSEESWKRMFAAQQTAQWLATAQMSLAATGMPGGATGGVPDRAARTMAGEATAAMADSAGSRRPAWDPAVLDDPFSQKPHCDVDTFLVILVTSAPANFEKRRAIRQSWGVPSKQKQLLSAFGKSLKEDMKPGGAVRRRGGVGRHSSHTTWRTIFLIGKAETPSLVTLVEHEAVTFADVLIGDYSDTYRNLTLKVVHGLRFAADNCRPAYLLKTDDDCFVNALLIVSFLRNYNRVARGLYVGNVQVASGVIRNPASKWYVSTADYSPSRYPPYASGTGYIVSADALRSFVATTHHVKPFPNEDAYVGVVMQQCGVSPRNSYRFTLYSHRWQHCNYLYLMVIHRVPADQQTSLYNKSMQAADKCLGQEDITTWS